MITYNSMEMGVDSFPVHLKSSLGKILVEEEKKKKKRWGGVCVLG